MMERIARANRWSESLERMSDSMEQMGDSMEQMSDLMEQLEGGDKVIITWISFV